MIFLTIYLLAIIIAYPIWDYFYMQKVDQQLVSKSRIYLDTIVPQWLLVFLLFIYWLVSDKSIRLLFIHESILFHIEKSVLMGAAFGFLFALVAVILIAVFKRPKKKEDKQLVVNENINFLIPHTIKERVLFGLVAVTAGFCEEVIFRGAMVYYLSHLPFDLSLLVIGIISSILFGIIHLYQGWLGVTQATILGGVLFVLFVVTGNLWVPIILHFLVDVKFVFYPPLII